MNLRTILILVLTAIWFVVCSFWYVCGIKKACDGDQTKTENPTKPTIAADDERPLLFAWSSPDPIQNPATFAAFKEKILENMAENNNLEIEGIYYEGEDEAIGKKRAEEVMKLFSETVPSDRFKLDARLVKGKTGLKDILFEACSIFWIDKEEEPDPSGDGEDDDDEGNGDLPDETVVKLADRILIYHLFNSTEKTVDPKVDDYLDKLAQRLSQTKERVSLTGHTDDKGTVDYNQKLGLDRANAIKAILVEKGVSSDRIDVKSMGESDHIDSNDTELGRQKNRRTEVLLLSD